MRLRSFSAALLALGVGSSCGASPDDSAPVASTAAAAPPKPVVVEREPPPRDPAPTRSETSESGEPEELDEDEEPTPIECKLRVWTRAGGRMLSMGGQAGICEELRSVRNLGVESGALRLELDGKVLSLRPERPRRFGGHGACWTVNGPLTASNVWLTVVFSPRRCG